MTKERHEELLRIALAFGCESPEIELVKDEIELYKFSYVLPETGEWIVHVAYKGGDKPSLGFGAEEFNREVAISFREQYLHALSVLEYDTSRFESEWWMMGVEASSHQRLEWRLAFEARWEAFKLQLANDNDEPNPVLSTRAHSFWTQELHIPCVSLG